MFLSTIFEKKTGRVLLAYYHSRRVNGKVKHDLVSRIGYVDELEADFEDPVAHFRAEAKRLTGQEKQDRFSLTIAGGQHFSFETMEPRGCKGDLENVDRVASYGVLPLMRIYHELEIDYFINNRRRYTKAEFNHNSIFKLLVFGRILFPDSKLGTWQSRERLAGDMSFTADDVYRSLGFFARHKDALIGHLDSRIAKQYGRDTSLVFYDVTNYFWETDHEDALRRRGVSKEHRPEPIVQMGLFMDADAIPITYGLFPGNENDVSTFIPMQEEMKGRLHKSKMIYVADKGMMSGMNVGNIIIDHNGYVISSSVRGCAKDVEDFILSDEGYTSSGDGEFKHKSRLVPIKRHVVEEGTGKRKAVQVNERQIVFFSRKYQTKARHDRMQSIGKAMKVAGNGENTVLNNHAGNRFIKKTITDGASGKTVDEAEFSFSLDTGLLAHEEALDGYYLICSNVVGTEKDEPPFKGAARFRSWDNLFELNRVVSDMDIIDMYRGLWRIEECFRITKSSLEARPVYVSRGDSIEAHFLTCFVALLILRLLEKRTGELIPVGAMVESLRNANLGDIEGECFMNLYCDPYIESIGRSLGIDMTRKYYSPSEVRKLFAEVKKI